MFRSQRVRACLGALIALCFAGSSFGREVARKPNVVLIVSDDLGYAHLGHTGNERVTTPHIDSIFERGVTFTSGYVSSPSCAPSRAGLLTGRYQSRYGYESRIGTIPKLIKDDIGVDTREILLSQWMKRAGYATAAIGKWHLGYNEKYHPNNRGFDEFLGFLARGRYYLERKTKHSRLLRDKDVVTGEGYTTEMYARQAADFIHRNKSKPFFLYFAPRNVHVPHVVPEKYVPEGGTVMDGMINALDHSVGVILETLKAEGLERDTLVIYINDNGASDAAANRPFRGTKATLYEGGIRVPFAMCWPDHLPQGRRYDHPVIQLDIFPTVVAAVGGSLPQDRDYDGVDLAPYLSGRISGPPHEALFWRFDDKGKIRRAVRAGSLKLIVPPGAGPADERIELFDLSEDPGETADLGSLRSADVRRLMGLLDTWERGVREPNPYEAGKS